MSTQQPTSNISQTNSIEQSVPLSVEQWGNIQPSNPQDVDQLVPSGAPYQPLAPQPNRDIINHVLGHMHGPPRLSCALSANYVPKCQMSSGPYGPIFMDFKSE